MTEFFLIKQNATFAGYNRKHNFVSPLLLALLLLTYITGCKKSLDDPNVTADATALQQTTATINGNKGINVLLNTPITSKILTELNLYGNVQKQLPAINALSMNTTADNLTIIKKLPYVIAANPDAERKGSPVDAVAVTDFTGGRSTWNLDAINVTDLGVGRTIAQDGTGCVCRCIGHRIT